MGPNPNAINLTVMRRTHVNVHYRRVILLSRLFHNGPMGCTVVIGSLSDTGCQPTWARIEKIFE